jgi:hypothetical protein
VSIPALAHYGDEGEYQELIQVDDWPGVAS